MSDIIASMNLRDKILQKLGLLPNEKQNQVLKFIEYISAENSDVLISNDNEDKEWSEFSLSNAIQDMTSEEEDIYTMDDIKIKYNSVS